ncbi:Transmembrane protein [Balamuthia mandrillaris]
MTSRGSDFVALEVIITVVTNISTWPGVVLCWRREWYYEVVLGAAAFLTSVFYHVADIHHRLYPRYKDWLGMTSGNWHRLDNIFCILCLNSLAFFLSGWEDRKSKELFRWVLLCWTLWCQERGPWDVTFTLLPIATSIVCVMLRLLQERLLAGCLLMSIAFVFFVLGLDERNDFLRIYHGLWHMLGGLAMWAFLSSKKDVPCVQHHHQPQQMDGYYPLYVSTKEHQQ